MQRKGTHVIPGIVEFSQEEFMTGYNDALEKRSQVNKILAYINTEKFTDLIALRGFAHTGQHTILQQVFAGLSEEQQKHTKFYDVEYWTRKQPRIFQQVFWDDLKAGYRIFFLKNISDTREYQRSGDFLLDTGTLSYEDVRIVLYGENPASLFVQSGYDETFCDRVCFVDCSYVGFNENGRLLKAMKDNRAEDVHGNESIESYQDYLMKGPVTQRSFTRDPEQVKKYIRHTAEKAVRAQSISEDCQPYQPLLVNDYDVDTLTNTLQNLILQMIADITKDAICYALIQQHFFRITVDDSDKIMNKIRNILGFAYPDISNELWNHCIYAEQRHSAVVRAHSEYQLTPTADELSKIVEAEQEYVHNRLIDLMCMGTAQECALGVVVDLQSSTSNECSYDIRSSIAFQNTGLVYTLAHEVLREFWKGGWFANLNLQDPDGFSSDFEDLLISRLAAHNIMIELWGMCEDPGIQKRLIMLPKGYFWSINYAMTRNRGFRFKCDQSDFWQIVIGPGGDLKEATWAINRDEKFKKFLFEHFGSPLEQYRCDGHDGSRIIARMSDDIDIWRYAVDNSIGTAQEDWKALKSRWIHSQVEAIAKAVKNGSVSVAFAGEVIGLTDEQVEEEFEKYWKEQEKKE